MKFLKRTIPQQEEEQRWFFHDIIFIRKLFEEDKMWSFLHSHAFIGENIAIR